MVIEKVHGLQATNISLNERFTMLASAAPDRFAMNRKRRNSSPTIGSFLNQSLNIRDRRLIEQIALRLQFHAKKQALRQRLGGGQGQGLRRAGSESSLYGMRRSNSFSNFSQASVKNRVFWRQPNTNFNRSASFGNLSQGVWRDGRLLRGFRRRGGGNRPLRGRFRGVGGTHMRLRSAQAQPQGKQMRGLARRGRGRGGFTRDQTPNPVPTREELDAQLDQYMSSTKSALDKELDTYMKNAMDLE